MVQTLSRARSNLWGRQQSGLYIPTPGRKNFPLGGLTLFLPLWHPELSGTPIISKDSNAYSVTIVGTTQGLTGRLLDATDDSLTFGDTSTIAWMHGKGNTTAFKWTFLLWFNQLHPGTANAVMFDTCVGSSVNTGVDIYTDTLRRILTGIMTGTSGQRVLSNTSVGTYPNSTAFNCLGITYDQSLATANLNLYLAGVWLESGNKTAVAPKDGNASYAPSIGRFATPSGAFDGTIGEMVIINGVVLTAGQILNYYKATKWRYL